MFKNYLLTAYKVFMRRKLFTAINLLCIVLTLVVLIVITALFEFAIHPTGVEGKSARFLQVHTIEMRGPNGRNVSRSPLGYKTIDKVLRPLKSAEMVAAVSAPQSVSVYQPGRVTARDLRRADAEYWQILDFKVLAGRVPTKDDVAQGRLVIVLNQSTANRLFPGAAAVGQSLNVAGQNFEVIGVVEDVIHLNAYSDMWAPVTSYPSTTYRDQQTGEFTAIILGRSSADLPAIQAEVEQAARQFAFDDPKAWKTAHMWADNKLDLYARALLGRDDQADSGAKALLSILGVLMLLFMSLPALNMINLNTGRILERSGEIGVRKAFGATNGQLVVQFIVENLLLCVAGGLLGLLAAQGVLLWLEQSQLIPYLKVGINPLVFVYGLLISLVFGLMSGVIPAWKMARLDPVRALKGAL